MTDSKYDKERISFINNESFVLRIFLREKHPEIDRNYMTPRRKFKIPDEVVSLFLKYAKGSDKQDALDFLYQEFGSLPEAITEFKYKDVSDLSNENLKKLGISKNDALFKN